MLLLKSLPTVIGAAAIAPALGHGGAHRVTMALSVDDGFALENSCLGENVTASRMRCCGFNSGVCCWARCRAARTTASAWLPCSAAIFRCAAITSPSE